METEAVAAPLVRKYKLVDLEMAEYNPRTIDDASMVGLRESVAKFGMLEMPVVNVFGGKKRLISGHQRTKAMIAEGIQFADCVVVSFDDTKEKMANLTMNNRALQGIWDAPKALPLVKSISIDLPRPDAMGFQRLMDEIRHTVEKEGKAAQEKSASDELTTDKIAKPKSKPGETYKLGNHRLYCGEMQTGIPKLLGKKQAAACITDPPYNVDYETADGDSIENDDMSDPQWAQFMADVCAVIVKKTDGPCYVFMASKEIPSLARAWVGAGGIIQRWLVWTKDRFTLSRGDYHHQYEPCLYGYRTGLTPPAPTPSRSNVLEFPKPKTNPLHPTMKPVLLIEALMKDCTQPGQVVIDPFGGSGTTLCVAETLGRICFTSELDPRFADVIRQRWAEQAHGAGADWQKLTPSA